MQRRVALWIMEAFCILSSWDFEAITGLIPIQFHLGKIIGCHHL